MVALPTKAKILKGKECDEIQQGKISIKHMRFAGGGIIREGERFDPARLSERGNIIWIEVSNEASMIWSKHCKIYTI
jgi:hypothetical protein